MVNPKGTKNITIHDETYNRLSGRRRYRRESFDEIIELALIENEKKVAIEDDVLARVKELTGEENPTEAVDVALKAFIQYMQEVKK